MNYEVHLTDGSTILTDKLLPGDFVVESCPSKFWIPIQAVYKIIDPNWHKYGWKPWHMAFVLDHVSNCDVTLFEAWWTTTRISYLSDHSNYRIYRWFGLPANNLSAFCNDRWNCKYDVLAYMWTFIYYLSGKRFPRIYNKSYTCWELCAELAILEGKPWCDMWDYPLVTDFLEAMNYNGDNK